MKKNNLFQTITIAIFAVFAVVGVIVFSLQRGSGGDRVDVSVWGTMDRSVISEVVSEEFGEKDPITVNYKQFSEENFDTLLVEALADGRGPDVVIMSQDRITRHKQRIFTIPYDSFKERDFRNDYIDGADIFLSQNGVVGIPFSVDPLVMYWNKPMFSNAGFVAPISYWDELVNVIPKISQNDFSGNVIKATVPFGEFLNVRNAKEIFSAMLMQSGTNIVERNGNDLRNVLEYVEGNNLPVAQTVLRFYTEFSDPAKPVYSWNRSMPDSRKVFLSGDLAMYFGLASELRDIRDLNPNLNFDVAQFPQIRNTDRKLTFANINALVVMKANRDLNAAISTVSRLSSDRASTALVNNAVLPSVKRSLLREEPEDLFMSTFYDSAIISKTWIDPDREGTYDIFANMIGSVTSGSLRISDSVRRASLLLDKLIK